MKIIQMVGRIFVDNCRMGGNFEQAVRSSLDIIAKQVDYHSEIIELLMKSIEASQEKKTLRDEFAMAALNPKLLELTKCNMPFYGAVVGASPAERIDWIAKTAYQIADVMLEERAKNN